MQRLEFKKEDFEVIKDDNSVYCATAAEIAQNLFDKWFEDHKIDELERYHFVSTGYKFDWE